MAISKNQYLNPVEQKSETLPIEWEPQELPTTPFFGIIKLIAK